MATAYQPVPLDVLLGSIPGLPRPVLSRLVARMIDRLDEIDGDPDLEDDDPGGGNVEDAGEDDRAETADDGCHGLDERHMWHRGGHWREA